MERVFIMNRHSNEPVAGRREGWCGRHPVLAYVIICFGFSWGLWSLMILSSHGMLPFRFPTSPLGAFGPAVGAIVVTGFSRGRSGARQLLAGLRQWRERGALYLFCTLSTAVMYALAIAAWSLTHRSESFAIQNLDRWTLVFPLALYILILGGPLTEEIGWRGFLLPILLRRMGSLRASLFVGVIWASWHLPDFWLEGAAQKGSSIAFFAVTVLILSVIYTWVYNKTHGSLFVAVFYHFWINMTSFCLAVTVPTVIDSKIVTFVFLGIAAGTALALTLMTRGSLGLTPMPVTDREVRSAASQAI